MRHDGQPSVTDSPCLAEGGLDATADPPRAVAGRRVVGSGFLRRTLGAATLVPVCGLLATACGSSHSQSATKSTPGTHPPVTPSGQSIGHLSTPGTPKGEQAVSIEVIATPGQSKRQTMALVPVTIDGQGPFPFALDTGASRSLIALPLAQRLHLPRRGSAGTLFGIGGGRPAQNVAVAQWRAGKVALPAEVIAAISSPSKAPHPGPKTASPQNARGPVGLLGSDVLSRYGKIAIDYDKGLLILDPSVK